jgi:DNA invertase Pin-like site-specific DNA recombinase
VNTEITQEPHTKCVVYARVATNDGDALKRQIEAVTAFAAKQSFNVIAVFGDSGSGRKAVAERPGLVAALKAIEDGRATALVVRDDDRVARD